MNSREAIAKDAADLSELAKRVADTTHRSETHLRSVAVLGAPSGDFAHQERHLDEAAWNLRQWWLRLAHRPADKMPKSPCGGQSTRIASGAKIDFGYERDLDESVLEQRSEGYVEAIPGWSNDLVLFRSGQAALSALLQLAIGCWGGSEPLMIAHSGAYFETVALLQAWPSRILQRSDNKQDLVIAEPVWCDGRFGCGTIIDPPRRILLVDTTMVGPNYNLRPYLDGRCPIVVAYSSGLKLDQAGLELANVGFARIYTRNSAESANGIATRLREIRTLTGTGLTLDELSALSAPWFMDRNYVDRYTDSIFANNRAFAQGIGTKSNLFADACHPSLIDPEANAPFCALELHDPTREHYRRLLMIVENEIDRRGLLAANGGSFGFRGHRFQLVTPSTNEGRTFLRIALGWRDGFSRTGLCDLFEELSERGLEDRLGRL